MDIEELKKDAKRAKKEIDNEKEEMEKDRKVMRIVGIIIGIFMAFAIIMWVVPGHYIQVDPPPKRIPGIAEVTTQEMFIEQERINFTSIKSYYLAMEPENENVKRVANKIVSISCKGTPVCEAKALFYFVRDNIDYVKDPRYQDYLERSMFTLMTGAGDCDDHTILLANLYEAIGIRTRFVFVPNHVYVQIWLPDAPRYLKDENGWINADATCKSCELGEISINTAMDDKRYLEN